MLTRVCMKRVTLLVVSGGTGMCVSSDAGLVSAFAVTVALGDWATGRPSRSFNFLLAHC